MVFSNQQAYYDAITASSKAGNSGPFIDFMLGEILETLRIHQGEELKIVHDKVHDKLQKSFPDISEATWKLYAFFKANPNASALSAVEELEISERMVRKHIAVLKAAGLLVREGSNKTGPWRIVK